MYATYYSVNQISCSTITVVQQCAFVLMSKAKLWNRAYCESPVQTPLLEVYCSRRHGIREAEHEGC